MDGIERGDLLDALAQMGFAAVVGMGALTPLPWVELQAFNAATERGMTPWEFETLRLMSAAYCTGRHEGQDLFSIPPMERDA